jgi:hypothetical protein
MIVASFGLVLFCLAGVQIGESANRGYCFGFVWLSGIRSGAVRRVSVGPPFKEPVLLPSVEELGWDRDGYDGPEEMNY